MNRKVLWSFFFNFYSFYIIPEFTLASLYNLYLTVQVFLDILYNIIMNQGVLVNALQLQFYNTHIQRCSQI